MLVIFIGDKPSRLNSNPEIAFKGARCYSRLLSWIAFLEPQNYYLCNSHNETELKFIKMMCLYPDVKFITLGKKASKRIMNMGITPFILPHPSGLNRQNNSPEFINERLNKCKEWLYNEI